MFSFITSVKSLSAITECVLRLEVWSSLSCIASERTLYTRNYLLRNFKNKQKCDRLNIRSFHSSRSLPKKFGRVVELGDDFNELVFEDKQTEKKKERNRIKNETKVYMSAISDAKEVEVNELDEEERSGWEKTDKGLLGKRTYKDLDKNAALLASIVSKLRSKKLKEQNQEILLEGKRIIHEAILAGLEPQKIFFCRASDLDCLNLPTETETYRIPYKCCELWSDTKTPSGILGVFRMPDSNTIQAKSNCLPLTVICDNVRDPGNLGSIIRVAASVGCEKLILTPGCTGAWEPKVLRAGAGAHFYLPILKNYIWSDTENLIGDKCKVFIADSHNEFDDKFLKSRSNFLSICGGAENLPLTSYYSVEFENESTVFIIGGETEGVSEEAFKFAQKRNGTRVFIPVLNNIESLNNSVALAVLAFEFKRQLNCAVQKEPHQSPIDSTSV